MTALTIEPQLAPPSVAPQPVRPPRRRPPTIRPGRGTGRGSAPQAQPGHVLDAPTLRRRATGKVQACRPVPVEEKASSWRLTDRGIAAVLTVFFMIAFAGMTMVGLTALRVTSPSYQMHPHIQPAQP